MYNLDVAALIHSRRFRQVLALLGQLPRTSRVKAAIMNDDEILAGIDLGDPEEAEDSGPELTDWSMTVEMLASVYDAINALIGVTIQVNSDKRRSMPKPLPRPRTAIDRARERRRKAIQEEILTIFAPGRS